MATPEQSKYISDLVVIKTKEFKEVKELLVSNDIVKSDATIVNDAKSIDEINHALTDTQASSFIDVLVKTKEPTRGTQYSKRRVVEASNLVDGIKSTINRWTF